MMKPKNHIKIRTRSLSKTQNYRTSNKMNLIENIQRINTLISENDRGETIKNLVNRLGVADAIKMTGNYYMIEPYLKEIDKVNYIKERVRELGDGGGFRLTEIDEEPLHYGEEDGELHQIEWLGQTIVDISRYDDEIDTYLGDYSVNYESLPGQILDELVEILINK